MTAVAWVCPDHRNTSDLCLCQEPLANFRRDVAEDDELRLRVEAIARQLLRLERIAVAWAVKRIRGDDDLFLTAAEVLR